MFRSVVYGACLRNGDPPPSLTRQKELADELRAKVIHSLVSTLAYLFILEIMYFNLFYLC
jgi:OTU domain-containing protein 6